MSYDTEISDLLCLQVTIKRLEHEKGKLENYAKKTLTAFKDKYMAALQDMKQEKIALEGQVAALTSKVAHNQETSRREEELLRSAMYDVSTLPHDLYVPCLDCNSTMIRY